MADPFSPDAFYESARDFAQGALEAHHAGNRRRVPVDAGTALEHLAKACLAQRSPVLLAELKNESSVNSVIGLLRLEGTGVPPSAIRTVGLSDALKRVSRFTRSKAVEADLNVLIAMRNGIVHAAESSEVEERILAAFAQQADALLADLGRDRADFWRGQLPVVDALLMDASNKLAHLIEVRLASARARLEQRYAAEGEAVISLIKALRKSAPETATRRLCKCPVCESFGTAAGEHSVEWDVDWDKETGNVTNAAPSVWFTAYAFRCQVCGLHLDTQAEIDACFDPVWEIEDADWRDYEPDYEIPDVDWREYESEDDALAPYAEWREYTDEL
ncbi:hypothetical protein EAS64_10420 [Trebonia kvetii]|uniref:Uncharacterized protein n=1 Tax=Trebonia kvetii TaxID=2480626 RepID=A0A6P2C3H3_9ACTN|nr:hypothetical protein [Trebonia kvetii]TVZ05026.1 hypothetical protein EAS64_10420 [Trebonia kvetii]